MTTLVGSRKPGLIMGAFPGAPVLFAPASTIPNRSVRWAIPCLIALGDVTIFAGPKKCGKSMMAAHLAACFTRGIPFAPGLFVEAEAQGGVLLYNGERAIDCFAKPRCEAAGADLDSLYIEGNAYTLDDVIADIEKRPPTIRLVIIDPLKAIVDAARVSDAKARQLLRRLEMLARDRDLAIVIMHHVTLRGRKSDDPTDYIQGKRVWIEASLCACMLCPLGDGHMVQNVASNKLAGQRYEYQIKSHRLADGTETERIDMLGETKHDIVHALNGQAGLMTVKSKLQRALEWLLEYLKDGPRLRNSVYSDGQKAGFSEPTLMRAKQEGCIEDRKRLVDGLSEWYLPAATIESHDPVDSVDSVADAATTTTGSTGSTGPSCWYTPEGVMGALHEVLGPCEIDVCSPAKPVHVQARRWFTQEQDGLKQCWRIPENGWIFLNPPWNAEATGEPKPIPLWTDKLIIEIGCGNLRRAVVLLPFKSSASVDKLKAAGAAIINLRRLKYGGAPSTSRDDTACFLLGFARHEVDALAAAFKRHGLKRAEIERYGPPT